MTPTPVDTSFDAGAMETAFLAAGAVLTVALVVLFVVIWRNASKDDGATERRSEG